MLSKDGKCSVVDRLVQDEEGIGSGGRMGVVVEELGRIPVHFIGIYRR